MSVVCAKVYDDRIEIAADSCIAIEDFVLPTTGFQKLFAVGDMLIGSAGLCEEITLMKSFLEEIKEDMPKDASFSSMVRLVREFYEYCKEYRDDISELQKPGDGERNLFLIVYKSRLYYVNGADVFEVENYTAIGSGSEAANTAMYLGYSPEDAVKTAAALNAFVRLPVVSYVIKK